MFSFRKVHKFAPFLEPTLPSIYANVTYAIPLGGRRALLHVSKFAFNSGGEERGALTRLRPTNFYQRVALRAPADQWPIWAQFEEGKHYL